MSLWRRFQEIASKARAASVPGPVKTLYLDEAYCRVKGEPCWALLALGENQRGQRGFLGALLSSDRSQEAWQKLLETLPAAGGGTGLTVMHDGDGALAAPVALALPEAQQRLCLWHQLQNLFRQARDRYPGQQERQREAVQAGKERLCPPQNYSHAPLEPWNRLSRSIAVASALWTASALSWEPPISCGPGWSRRTPAGPVATGWRPWWHNA